MQGPGTVRPLGGSVLRPDQESDLGRAALLPRRQASRLLALPRFLCGELGRTHPAAGRSLFQGEHSRTLALLLRCVSPGKGTGRYMAERSLTCPKPPPMTAPPPMNSFGPSPKSS